LEYSKNFDRVVHNDNLEDAQQTAINLVKAFIDA
jgi:hypothetical protein